MSQISAYIELTKPRLNAMVLFTTAAGFLLALDGNFSWPLFLNTLFATTLVAGGTCGLNECWEREYDAQMRRTMGRPLPARKLTPAAAWGFCTLLSVAGILYLAAAVNWLSAWLALLTAFIYVFVYTPYKRKNSLCTLVGAISGAIPPMIGWAAAQNRLGAGAWILFAILFLWQIPAFLSIAWIYRNDYSRGGFPMLTVKDRSGKATSSQILLFSVALIWASLLPPMIHLANGFYFAGAVALGLGYFAIAYFSVRPAAALNRSARRIWLASLLYLPLLLSFMVVDKMLI